jgi:mRNA interferase YafQ
MSKLRDVLTLLIEAGSLATRFKGPSLVRRLARLAGLAIEPDWLLYKIEGNDLILGRTGSHSDLFR